eukprot:3985693-Pyramimonas_sp.AAC.1
MRLKSRSARGIPGRVPREGMTANSDPRTVNQVPETESTTSANRCLSSSSSKIPGAQTIVLAIGTRSSGIPSSSKYS